MQLKSHTEQRYKKLGEIPEEITAKPLPKLMIYIKLKIEDTQLIQKTKKYSNF